MDTAPTAPAPFWDDDARRPTQAVLGPLHEAAIVISRATRPDPDAVPAGVSDDLPDPGFAPSVSPGRRAAAKAVRAAYGRLCGLPPAVARLTFEDGTRGGPAGATVAPGWGRYLRQEYTAPVRFGPGARGSAHEAADQVWRGVLQIVEVVVAGRPAAAESLTPIDFEHRLDALRQALADERAPEIDFPALRAMVARESARLLRIARPKPPGHDDAEFARIVAEETVKLARSHPNLFPARRPDRDATTAETPGPRFPLPTDLPQQVWATPAERWEQAKALLDRWHAAWRAASQKLGSVPSGGSLPDERLDAWRLEWARQTLSLCKPVHAVGDVAALCDLGRVAGGWFRPRGTPYHREVVFTLYREPLSTPDGGMWPIPRVDRSTAEADGNSPAAFPGPPATTGRNPDPGCGYADLLRQVGFLLGDQPLTAEQDRFVRCLGYDVPEWCRDWDGPHGGRHWVASHIAERCQEAIRRLSRGGLGVKPVTLPADRPFPEVLDLVEGWVVETGVCSPGAAGDSGRTDPGRTPPDPWSRVRLEPAGCLVRLDGQSFGPIDPTAFLLFQLLFAARGGLVPGKSITKAIRDKYRQDSRPDRVRKKLPDALGGLIRADTGKGYWLVLPPQPRP